MCSRLYTKPLMFSSLAQNYVTRRRSHNNSIKKSSALTYRGICDLGSGRKSGRKLAAIREVRHLNFSLLYFVAFNIYVQMAWYSVNFYVLYLGNVDFHITMFTALMGTIHMILYAVRVFVCYKFSMTHTQMYTYSHTLTRTHSHT